MPIRADAEERQVEVDVLERVVVGPRRLDGRERGVDGVEARRRPCVFEQRLAQQPRVRPVVVGGDAPLVREPGVDSAPVGLERGRERVRPSRRGATGERDMPTTAGSLREQAGCPCCGRLGILEDDELRRRSRQLQRGAAPPLDLEESDEEEADGRVDRADEELGAEQRGHVGEGGAGHELARRFDPVRDGEALRDCRQPAGQEVERDVGACREQEEVEEQFDRSALSRQRRPSEAFTIPKPVQVNAVTRTATTSEPSASSGTSTSRRRDPTTKAKAATIAPLTATGTARPRKEGDPARRRDDEQRERVRPPPSVIVSAMPKRHGTAAATSALPTT